MDPCRTMVSPSIALIDGVTSGTRHFVAASIMLCPHGLLHGPLLTEKSPVQLTDGNVLRTYPKTVSRMALAAVSFGFRIGS